MQTLPIDKIRTDGGTQPRAAIDFAAVDDYTDAMQEGVKFPPVVVFYDGSDYWLADGFHRCKAAFGAGMDEIACDVHQGTREDAQWYSFSANKTHGLRRTNDDKQRAVKAALKHPTGAGKSNREIGRHVGVDEATVRGWREKLHLSAEVPQMTTRTVTRNGKAYQQDTTRIGKPAPDAAPQPEPAPRSKWQETREKAAYRRFVDGISHIRGTCRALGELNLAWVRNECEGAERKEWANEARRISQQLRELARQMDV